MYRREFLLFAWVVFNSFLVVVGWKELLGIDYESKGCGDKISIERMVHFASILLILIQSLVLPMLGLDSLRKKWKKSKPRAARDEEKESDEEKDEEKESSTDKSK